MSQIACEGCGDVIDVQTNRVDLPFLCSECIAREETVDEGGMHDPEEDGQVDLDTEMIEDLQEQLEAMTKRAEMYKKWSEDYWRFYEEEARKPWWRKLWEL